MEPLFVKNKSTESEEDKKREEITVGQKNNLKI